MTKAVTLAELADQNVLTALNNKVGIATTNPQSTLQVGIAITMDGNAGVITAQSYYGDGSNLTGIDASSLSDTDSTIRVQANTSGAVVTGILTATGVDVTGVVTATTFVGSGEGLTGVASTDNIITGTAATFTNDVNISGITTVGVLTAYTRVTVGNPIIADAASGIITATGVNATGIVSATTFVGNLTGNSTGNLTGNVTGNLTGDVTGDLTGNVTGNVTGNATGLSGSPSITVTNITAADITASGTLTYEDVTNVDSVGIVTAGSGLRVVGGGITVTGVSTFFDNAQFGESGVGGTITAAGQAEFAGIVTATGVNATGVVTATTFEGNVTGNLTGNVTGNVTGNLTGDVTGDITASNTVEVGAGVTISGTSGITLNEATNASHIINPLLINYAEKVNALGNTGSSATIDVADGTFVTATLNANCSFTLTAPPSGKLYGFALQLTNDGTANRTISFPNNTIKWSGGSVPTRTTNANKTDVWSFFTSDGGSNWYGAISLFNY